MNAQPLTIVVDPRTASLLQEEVQAGRFASTTIAVAHAVEQLTARRKAVAHLIGLADEALADMDDLVDHDTVMRESRAAIDKVSAERGA